METAIRHSFITIRPAGNLWEISFTYDQILVEAMREIGADWDASRKVWVVAEVAKADALAYANATAGDKQSFLDRVRAEKIKNLGVPKMDLSIPLAPAGLTLKPYQIQGVQFIANRTATLLADQPGLGKTQQAIAAINSIPGFSRVLIVCPANMKRDWYTRMKGDPAYSLPGWLVDQSRTVGVAQGSYLPPTDIVIINYDILLRHRGALEQIKWDLIVVDECFVAGTKISTPYGDKNIEDIELGDPVLNATGLGIVDAISRRTVDAVYELEFSDGTITHCTGNHPYFTESAWRKAEEMELGRFAYRQQDVSRLWGSFQAEDDGQSRRTDESNILGSLEQADFLRTELLKEAEEPHPLTGCPRKVIGDTSFHGPQSEGSWRKREARAIASIQSAVGTWFGMGSGISGIDEDAIGDRVSDLLQGGHSQSRPDDSDRSGRGEPLRSFSSGAGQKEGRSSDQPRLVRVSRVELAGGCTVYNIGVTGHPSYFANGHLVHNCHYAKSPKAQRTKALCGGSRGRGKPPMKPLHAGRKLAMSGTPAVNEPSEIWAICNWLDPKRWPSLHWFEERYCTFKRKPIGRGRFVREYAGPKNLDELNQRLKGTIMLRRTKAEVLPDLPAKLRQVIEIDVNDAPIQEERAALRDLRSRSDQLQAAIQLARVSGQEEEYRKAIEALANFYKEKGEHVALLRQRVALAKLPYVIDHIRNLLLDPEIKVVVFAHHRAVVDALHEAFTKDGAVKLYGGMAPEEKSAAVTDFQHKPECRVFVGSILASGVGLTLTASSNVVFAELDWVPANVTQAEDRCHRIGQLDSVLVQHIVAHGSLDSHIAKQLIAKQEVLDRVLDGGLAAQEPVDWLGDHRSAPTEDQLSAPVPPTAIAASTYGLRRLVENPKAYGVSDTDLIIAERLCDRELVGKPAALAKWLMDKYLEPKSPAPSET